MNVIGLLPCAGTASRLFNLPKFMLPLRDDNRSLLSNWIDILINNKCDKIIIGTSEINNKFIEHIVHTQLSHISDKIIIKLVGITTTMNETVLLMLKNEDYKIAIMGMADTYIDKLSHKLIENVISQDNITVGAYVWNIRDTQVGKIGQCEIEDNMIIKIVDKDINCDYNYGWGAIVFKPTFEQYILRDQLHLGYSMQLITDKIPCEIMTGQYFDCGTINGYTEYLNYMIYREPVHIKGTIIIVAVYINNDVNNYDQLVKCLTQLRHIYQYETIIAVDNKSLNTTWYKVAKDLDINILYNQCDLHRYEIGAYRLALQNFRVDEYICIQGTMYVNTKLHTSLDKYTPDATSFGILENNLSWDNEGLELINKLLSSFNMNNWSNDPLVLWNCFCCNHLFMRDMLNSGIFDLPSNTKNHSFAFERILGCYINSKIGKVKCLDENSYRKIFLSQPS